MNVMYFFSLSFIGLVLQTHSACNSAVKKNVTDPRGSTILNSLKNCTKRGLHSDRSSEKHSYIPTVVGIMFHSLTASVKVYPIMFCRKKNGFKVLTHTPLHVHPNRLIHLNNKYINHNKIFN